MPYNSRFLERAVFFWTKNGLKKKLLAMTRKSQITESEEESNNSEDCWEEFQDNDRETFQPIMDSRISNSDAVLPLEIIVTELHDVFDNCQGHILWSLILLS